AHEQRRKRQIDDHVGVLTDAPRPHHGDRGREREPREEHHEVRGKRYVEDREEGGSHGAPQPAPSTLAFLSSSTFTGVAAAGFFSRDVNMSIAIKATPTQIEMSATLNVGQCFTSPFQVM